MFWSIIFCIPSRACYSTGFTVYFHVSAYPITQKTKFAHLTAQPALRHNTHSGCAKIHLFLLSIKPITRPLLNHVAQTGQGRAPTSAKFRAPVPSFPLLHPPEKKPNEAHSPRPLSSNNTPHTHLRHQLKDEQKKNCYRCKWCGARRRQARAASSSRRWCWRNRTAGTRRTATSVAPSARWPPRRLNSSMSCAAVPATRPDIR